MDRRAYTIENVPGGRLLTITSQAGNRRLESLRHRLDCEDYSLRHISHSEDCSLNCGADFPVRRIFQWKVQAGDRRLESLRHSLNY